MSYFYESKDRLVIETHGKYQVCTEGTDTVEFPVEQFISEESNLIITELCNQIAMLKTLIYQKVSNNPNTTTQALIKEFEGYQHVYTRLDFNQFRQACRHAIREIQAFGFSRFKYTSKIPAAYFVSRHITSESSFIKIQVYGHSVLVQRQKYIYPRVKSILDSPLYGNFILNDQTLMLSITGIEGNKYPEPIA